MRRLLLLICLPLALGAGLLLGSQAGAQDPPCPPAPTCTTSSTSTSTPTPSTTTTSTTTTPSKPTPKPKPHAKPKPKPQAKPKPRVKKAKRAKKQARRGMWHLPHGWTKAGSPRPSADTPQAQPASWITPHREATPPATASPSWAARLAGLWWLWLPLGAWIGGVLAEGWTAHRERR